MCSWWAKPMCPPATALAAARSELARTLGKPSPSLKKSSTIQLRTRWNFCRSPKPSRRTSWQKSIEPLLPLLTPDMIEALQLLGFNFRKALGEPLTELLADFLHSKGKRAPNAARQPQRK